MADLKERILPQRPISSINLRETTSRPSTSERPLFQGIRSWVRVDSSGNFQIMEVDKFTMMHRCDLPSRDLRLLDPLFVYPSTILGRDKAISMIGYSSTGGGLSVSAPVSPVSSPPDNRKLEKSLSIARSRHESMKSSESTSENIEELEMLLEAYFVVVDSILNKLTSLKEVTVLCGYYLKCTYRKRTWLYLLRLQF
ncbi:hypothetical protein MKX01_004923 [Papaver californicum]|nr:hypothetical protein MKX01_004923 [Papaver californicum]